MDRWKTHKTQKQKNQNRKQKTENGKTKKKIQTAAEWKL